jgi:hypothetical protein
MFAVQLLQAIAKGGQITDSSTGPRERRSARNEGGSARS